LKNIVLALEYDGSAFCGFQTQKGQATVQEALESALHRLTGERIRLIAAGRTDTGVHAAAQVINLRTASRIPLERWPAAANSVLSRAISVWDALEVHWDFHARKCVRSKTYLYHIWNAPYPSALHAQRTLAWPRPLDLKAMQEACSLLVGTHDFSSFACLPACDARPTRRTMQRAECTREQEVVRILLQADGFLYKMVRSIVGTLLRVGSGAAPVSLVAELLQSKRRAEAGPTVAPQGLVLWSVEYDCVHLRRTFSGRGKGW